MTKSVSMYQPNQKMVLAGRIRHKGYRYWKTDILCVYCREVTRLRTDKDAFQEWANIVTQPYLGQNEIDWPSLVAMRWNSNMLAYGYPKMFSDMIKNHIDNGHFRWTTSFQFGPPAWLSHCVDQHQHQQQQQPKLSPPPVAEIITVPDSVMPPPLPPTPSSQSSQEIPFDLAMFTCQQPLPPIETFLAIESLADYEMGY